MHIAFLYPIYLWLLLLLPAAALIARLAHRSLRERRQLLGLGLRLLLMAAIVLALAGIQVRFPSQLLTAVFILDASDSIPPEEAARGETFIRQAIETKAAGDQAAIVVFGADALVERLASSESGLGDLTSIPLATRTNIESALQLAQAILPAEGAKRLVLLSDGRENLGAALEQAELAALADTEIVFVPLGSEIGQVEVLIDALDSPADVRLGERFDLVVTVESSAPVNATLRIFEESALIRTLDISLHAGSNRILVPIEPASSSDQAGFRRFRAQIVPDVDTRLQNNAASSFTVVHGPPHVLLVAPNAAESENLARVLEAAEMVVARSTPGDLPTTPAELARYDAVVLVNVNAAALPEGAMQTLPVFVRELGRGLVMIGGADSFGAGGFLRTPLEAALPVDMDVRDRELQSNLALVLAVDKSGSMGRCHCDNPDLNQTYTRREVGQPKVDIAKEAVMRSAAALGQQDYLGVVAFDSSPHWVLELTRLPDAASLEGSISAFQADGQTNLYSGVTAAYQALQGVEARRKHVILMTDGWVRTGELTDLALEMKEQGITLSVVAAGEGSAEYLAALAQLGGGSFYPASDIFEVPNIFLKETVKSVGEYIIEEPFYPLPSAPSQVLTGIDVTNLPPLAGYNGTTGKNTARMDLLTARGDPLLATWQYGLGRSAVWTSDLKAQWAVEWIGWEAFPAFATQLVRWVLPTPSVEGLEAAARFQDGRARIELQAVGEDGQPLNYLDGIATIVGPDLETTEAPLRQVGPGSYVAESDISQPGTYLVRLGVNQGDQSLGQASLGLVVPYSPEYRSAGIDRRLLSELSEATGGGELTEPQRAFEHNLPAVEQAREFWWTLLLLAALLFPIDVMLRRLVITRRDLEAARSRAAGILRRRPGRTAPTQPGPPQVLGPLFAARDRTRHRREVASREGGEAAGAAPGGHPPAPDAAASPEPGDNAPQPADEAGQGTSDEALRRLKEAKKRARR